MRIAMVAYAFYDGNSRLQQYAKSLTARGDSVDFYCVGQPGYSKAKENDAVSLYGVQRRMGQESSRVAYTWHVILFFLRTMWILTRAHWKKPYDIIHVHSVPDILVFACWIPKLSGTPIILDIHDILPEFYAAKFAAKNDSAVFKFLVWVEKLSIGFADHVIVANPIWEDRLLSRSAKPGKVTTIGNHPNADLFYCRPSTRTDSKFIATYPGSLNWHQGLDIAVRAFATVVRQAPEAEFHIYTEGPERARLEGLARELGLEQNVKFNNFVSTENVIRIMANSDLGIVPKRSKSTFGTEAASTKILEFMSLGVPVVVSRTKIDSFYHTDATVKFYDDDDPEELAKAILQLHDNPALRKELARNALAYAREQGWDKKQHVYLAIVDRLAGRTPVGLSSNKEMAGRTN